MHSSRVNLEVQNEIHPDSFQIRGVHSTAERTDAGYSQRDLPAHIAAAVVVAEVIFQWRARGFSGGGAARGYSGGARSYSGGGAARGFSGGGARGYAGGRVGGGYYGGRVYGGRGYGYGYGPGFYGGFGYYGGGAY